MERFFIFWVMLCAVIAISASVYTFQKCGVKALFLGNGAAYAAYTGMCDK